MGDRTQPHGSQFIGSGSQNWTPIGNSSSTRGLFPRHSAATVRKEAWHNMDWNDPRAIAARSAISRKGHQTMRDNWEFSQVRDGLIQRLRANLKDRSRPAKRVRRKRMSLEAALDPAPYTKDLYQRVATARKETRLETIRRVADYVNPETVPEPHDAVWDIDHSTLDTIPDELQRDPEDLVAFEGPDRALATSDSGSIVDDALKGSE